MSKTMSGLFGISKNVRGRALRIAVGITVMAIILLAESTGAATEISSCTTISSPGTYVLNQNIIDSSASNCIEITSNDVVFDGAGHIIDGVDIYSTYGVYFLGLTNVTVKNVIVTDWDTGIYYKYALKSNIINNTANSNRVLGIFMQNSNNNILIGNIASNNGEGIELVESANNTLSGNNASNNDYNGIRLSFSGNTNNTFIDNIVNSNQVGFVLGSGIDGGSTNNFLSRNIVSNNSIGIQLSSFSNNNTVYDNYFNNANNVYDVGNNIWNLTKTAGVNIIGDPYLAGNVWANPSGSGFSQTCADSNSDGICDSPYTLDSSNIDYLPLVYKPGETVGSDTVGIYRNGSFYLRNSNSAGSADLSFIYGVDGDIPLVGDWNGDGVDTVGIYRHGAFYLHNSNSAGSADISFIYGVDGDIPLVGDWNGDGIDTVGIYRAGAFYLRNSNSAGNADLSFIYGVDGDTPLVGDWNGDGTDTVGIYRHGSYYLRNSNTAGNADLSFIYGVDGDTPLVGDWTGSGTDTVGIYRAGAFYLRNSNSAGNADMSFIYGISTDTPLVGDWNGS
ncbi:MAG: right-handed parallel beta-helix repeat-containing protein [Candidatus Methanoperedens sp.]|nr:right-handed parallel beta-helix repeat-containing protein [Candidatus Methanoperedens sp.]